MKHISYLIFAELAAAAPYIYQVNTRAEQPIGILANKPNNAILVPKDFVGFGMEAAFLPEFGTQFSVNLVDSLASRMSQPPILRIGGTSGDYYTLDWNQKTPRECVKGPCTSSDGIFSLGPSYFDAFKMFKNAQWSIQAPLPSPANLTTTLGYVSRPYNNIDDPSRVNVIALGNEVEFIYESGVQSYVDAALAAQAAIIKELNLAGANAKVFEIGNTASVTMVDSSSFTVGDILKTNINKNGLVKAAAEHWYQIGGGTETGTDQTMQNLMTNHTAITERFGKYLPDLNAAKKAGISYAIDEDAAVLSGVIDFAGGFGYALWAIDFNLAAMTRGVDRVANLAGRPATQRQFWNPGSFDGTQPPEVRAPYPSAIFVTDFICKDDPTVVVGIPTGNDFTSAHAIYDNQSKKLLRVALVNLRLYDGTTGGTRGQETFQVPVPDAQSVKVQRLRAGLGVAALGYDHSGPKHNVTWAGQQWNYKIDQGKGHYPFGSVEEVTVQVQNGIASIVVPDSEAVIVFV